MTDEDKHPKLGDKVKLATSGEEGKVIGVAHYLHDTTSFQVLYKAGDGRQVQEWWKEEEIVLVED